MLPLVFVSHVLANYVVRAEATLSNCAAIACDPATVFGNGRCLALGQKSETEQDANGLSKALQVAPSNASDPVRVWSLVAGPRAPFAAVLACELDPGGHLVREFKAGQLVRGRIYQGGNLVDFERMIGTGGSLGCMVSRTPAFSAAATIGLAKWRNRSHISLSLTVPISLNGAASLTRP